MKCSPSEAEFFLAQIKAQVSNSCTPPRVGRRGGRQGGKSSLNSKEQTQCFRMQKYFLIVKYENIFLLARTKYIGPENQFMLSRTLMTNCPLTKLTENNRQNTYIQARPCYWPGRISRSVTRINQEKSRFPTEAIWSLSKPLRFMCPKALSRLWSGQIAQGKSWHANRGNVLSRQLGNKVSATAVTCGQRAVNKNEGCLYSAFIIMNYNYEFQ